MNLKTVSLLAGFFFATLALFVQGVLPMLEPESNQIRNSWTSLRPSL